MVGVFFYLLHSDRYSIVSKWIDVSAAAAADEDEEGEDDTFVSDEPRQTANDDDNLPALASRMERIKLKSSRPLSNKAVDLRISVPSFCKAFPWHFLTDSNLEIVQLGIGFAKLFGRQMQSSGELHIRVYVHK